jgi:hypothetical protein
MEAVVPLICCKLSTRLHGVMLQMTAGFINRVFIFKSKIYVFEKVWD